MGRLGPRDYLVFCGIAIVVGVALGRYWNFKSRYRRLMEGVLIAGLISSLPLAFIFLLAVSKRGFDFFQWDDLFSFASYSIGLFLHIFLPFGIPFVVGMIMPHRRSPTDNK